MVGVDQIALRLGKYSRLPRVAGNGARQASEEEALPMDTIIANPFRS
jgi:hypothetical protein